MQKWLIDTLKASGSKPAAIGNNIFPDEAPEGTPTPYVVILPGMSAPVIVVGGNRIMVDAKPWVKVVANPADAFDIVAATDWLDSTLDNKTGSVTGLQVLSCVRGNGLQYYDEVQNRHMGFQFIMYGQAT